MNPVDIVARDPGEAQHIGAGPDNDSFGAILVALERDKLPTSGDMIPRGGTRDVQRAAATHVLPSGSKGTTQEPDPIVSGLAVLPQIGHRGQEKGGDVLL